MAVDSIGGQADQNALRLEYENQQQMRDEYVTQNAPKESLGLGGAGIKGGYQGVSNILGAPRDLSNWMAGSPVDKPVMGSDWLQGKFNDWVKYTSGRDISTEPQTTGEKIINRGSEFVTENMIPGMGVLNRAQKGGKYASALVGDAVDKPLRALGAESMASFGGGVGAEVANNITPGNTLAEQAGILLGSLTPTGAARGAKSAASALLGGGREMEANISTLMNANIDPSISSTASRDMTTSAAKDLDEFGVGGGRNKDTFNRLEDQARAEAERIASGMGGARSGEQAGRSVESGMKTFVSDAQDTASILYGALDQYLPSGTQVSVRNTLDAGSKMMNSIPNAPNLSQTLANKKVMQMGQALQMDAGRSGQISFEALSRFRTEIGKMLSDGLQSDVPNAQLKQLYAAISKDMEAAASTAGPQAANAFSRANKYWKSYIDRLDTTISPLAKKATPEAVFKALNTRDGGTQLRKLRRSIPAKDWGDVVSTTFDRLGTATPGQQNINGTRFSPETFITNWNRLSDGAKQELFGGNNAWAKDVENIVKAVGLIRDKGRIGMNPSGSGKVIQRMSAGATFLTGLYTAPVTTLGAVGGLNLLSRILANPNAAKWLVKSQSDPAERLPMTIARMAEALRDSGDEETAAAIEGM